MKKKRGFTLKSGNNIVAKGRKPSNFKMMGASPAKATGGFITRNGEIEELMGSEDQITRQARDIIKGNKRKESFNIATGKVDGMGFDDIRSNMESFENAQDTDNPKYKELESKYNKLVKGDFEGGKKTADVTLTDDIKGKHATIFEGLQKGEKTTQAGTFKVPEEERVPSVGLTGESFDVSDRETMISKIKEQSAAQMKKRGFKMKRKK